MTSQIELGLTPYRNTRIPQTGKRHITAGLFAGIGGIECGLSRAGHRCSLLCENDPSAAAVLSARFPKVELRDDVRKLTDLPPDITLLAAGFPCQDLSQAGRTGGILASRSGLVGEVFRLLQARNTPWVLLENVPFMLQLGRGAAMEILASSFEALGYRWAYRVVDARSFGLPQRRRRVYFLASNVGDPREILFCDDAGAPVEIYDRDVACGFYWTEGIRGLGWAVDAIPTLKGGSSIGIPSSPAILLPSRDLVTFDIRDAERFQGFPPDWTLPAESVVRRGARWKLVGNAVSVPAAAWLGERLANPGLILDLPSRRLLNGERWPTAAWNVGGGRFGITSSEWPLRKKPLRLEAFLRFETSLLSERATAGFLSRTRRAHLRFPEGFISSVEAHLKRVTKLSPETTKYGSKLKTESKHADERAALPRTEPVRADADCIANTRQIRQPVAIP